MKIVGELIHTPSCSSEELVFAERNRGHRGNHLVVDIVFLFILECAYCYIKGFLYLPPAWNISRGPLVFGGQARKRHININFFVRLVLGRPRVCPGDFTGFVPGTNPVKTWDKPGFSPYLHSGSPISPVCPWDSPGDEGRHRKFM